VWLASALLTILLLAMVPVLIGGSFILINCPQQEITVPIEDHVDQSTGLLVYYRTAGDPAKQPAVFLHGWGARTDGRCGIDGVIAALVEHGFYVVAPEHPGLNRSDPPRELWSYGEYADALQKLLEPLALKKPIIMGQSFGGGIASSYAERYGSNIRSLVLIDAVVSGRPVNFAMRMKHRWDNFAYNALASPSFPPSLKKRIVRLYLGVTSDMIDEKRVAHGAQMMLIDKHKDLEDPLDVDYRALPFPLILVWGDKDTWNTPMRRAREIHKEVEGSKLIVVPGTHTVLYQRPQEVIDLIVHSLQDL